MLLFLVNPAWIFSCSKKVGLNLFIWVGEAGFKEHEEPADSERIIVKTQK